MDLTNLTSADLKYLTGLLEKKESLVSQIEEIDRELTCLGSGRPASAAPRKSGRRRGQDESSGGASRGQLKAQIVAELQGAGAAGMSVKELAEKLGMPKANIYTWFGTTGKKVSEIQKLDKGVYAWAA